METVLLLAEYIGIEIEGGVLGGSERERKAGVWS